MTDLPHLPQRLTHLWRLGPSEVVVLVGAGGKTSLMEALARDYEDEGARVLLTTTTKVLPPKPGGRPLVTAPHLEALLRALRAEGVGGVGAGVGGGYSSPVVGRGLTPDGKVEGVLPEWVPALRDLPGVAAVLVEADGAAGLPLKAPAAWEPVVPPCASLVVAVAGLDAQGAALDAKHVHRPELLADLLDLELGDAIPPAALLRACVVGYEDRTPMQAGFLVFLNKADARPPAPELVEACAAAAVEVWSGAVAEVEGSRHRTSERMMRRLGIGDDRPSAVIPAAGLAARMGGPKVLAALGESTVLGRVVAAARESGVVREVVVVAGADTDAVEAALVAESAASARPGGPSPAPAGAAQAPADADVRVVRNPTPQEGMASSLRTGLEALRHPAGVLVMLGDQPFVHPATLRRLVEERAVRARAAAVGLAGGSGGSARPPVLVHRSLLPRMMELRGDEGARNLLARHSASVVCLPGAPEEALDVDRPEDLDLARRALAAEARPEVSEAAPTGMGAGPAEEVTR